MAGMGGVPGRRRGASSTHSLYLTIDGALVKCCSENIPPAETSPTAHLPGSVLTVADCVQSLHVRAQ